MAHGPPLFRHDRCWERVVSMSIDPATDRPAPLGLRRDGLDPDPEVTALRELNLRLTEDEKTTRVDFMVFLTVQTMNYLHSGRHRVAL